MIKKTPSQKRLTKFFYSICMLLLVANVSMGQQTTALQQVIGSFPIMDGGFEAQPLGASYQPLPTITANASNWTISTTPASTTRSVIANSSVARSGSNYVSFSNAGSTRLQSPIAALLGGTQYTVQYFYKSTLSPVSLSLTGAIYNTGGVNAALTPAPASAWVTNIWTKGSATFTSATATGSNYFASPRMGSGTADNLTILNVDDFVVYAGALDATAPSSPSASSVSGLAVSWTAPSGGVDGGGYVVVRYTTSPNADNDPNQNGIYAVSNTITNGSGYLTGTVVYIGTATSFTDSVAGSSAGNDYYKIYAVDKAFNYSNEITGKQVLAATYYYKGTGLLSSNVNWGTNADGTGSNPTLLTDANATFVIKSTTAISTDAAWVLGTGSKVIVGDVASPAVTFTITSGNAITGTIDIAAASFGSNSLILQDDTTLPTFGTLHSNSEVHFQMTNNTLGLTATFGKLFLDGTANLSVGSGATNYIKATIQTALTLETGSTINLSNGSNSYFYINTAANVTINGTLKTSKPAGIVGFNLATAVTDTNTSPALQFFDAENTGVNLVLTGSTIEFSRGGSTTAQIVAPRSDYNNVSFSDFTSAGIKTLTGNMTVSGILTMNHTFGTTFTGSGTITLGNGASIIRTSGDFGAIPFVFGTSVDVTYNGITAITSGAELPTPSSVLNNLIINNAAGVTLSSATAVNHKLTVSSGTLTTGGFLILKSTSTRTAVVAPVTGSISGDAIVERNIPAGQRAYRLLSSPVTTATSIHANWQEGQTDGANGNATYGMFITGTGGALNGFDTTTSNAASLYIYNNASPAWIAVTNTNANTFTAGSPYLAYIRGSRAALLNVPASTSTIISDATTLRTTGSLTTGSVTVSGLNTSANGFSLVGNPYQAQVDMSAVLAGATNLNTGYYYVVDPNLGTKGGYLTVDVTANATTHISKYLQPGQACFVNTFADGAASLTFLESNKSEAVSQTTIFKTKSTTTSGLDVTLYDASANRLDVLKVTFDGSESNDVNQNDAIKLKNFDESLATSNNDKLLAIEKRATPTTSDVIPLNVSNYKGTSYSLKLTGTSMIDTSYLVDNYTGSTTEIPLNGTVDYVYTVDTAVVASSAVDRFKVIYAKTLDVSSNTNATLTLYPNPSKSNSFSVVIPDSMTNASLTISSVLGQKLYTQSDLHSGTTEISACSIKTTGVYFVSLTSGGKTSTTKWIVE